MVAGGFVRRFLGSAVSNAAGYGVGGAILPTLEPLTQDLANLAWREHQVKPLGAGIAAEAALRGYLTDAEGAVEASYTGFDGERFGTLVQLAGSPPPLETLLSLRRRDAISPEQLEDGIAQSGLKPEWRSRVAKLAATLPSPTDLIRMAVREVFSPSQRASLNLDADFPEAFAEEAAKLGISREVAGWHWAAHWELPSYQQGAQMYFRGEISEADFLGLLRALDYAPVWREPLAAIARAIPTISDQIRFAVREVYNPTQRAALDLDAEYPDAFTAAAKLHGYAESDARDQWAAHWRLPSATQAFRMFQRGIITQAQLDGLIKALDYAPIWRDRLTQLSHIIPGRIDLKRFLRYEILTEAEVEDGYRALGYAPVDAANMTKIAVAELGASEAGQPWATRARSRLFTVAHTEYLDGSIDASTAQAMLAKVGATAAERTLIVSLWDAENTIARKELTPAQIKKAVTEDLLSREDALARLELQGVTAEDAAILLDE